MDQWNVAVTNAVAVKEQAEQHTYPDIHVQLAEEKGVEKR